MGERPLIHPSSWKDTAKSKGVHRATLRRNIYNYSKTRIIYEAYKKSGFDKNYYDEHHVDIELFHAAKEAFKAYGPGELPKVSALKCRIRQNRS